MAKMEEDVVEKYQPKFYKHYVDDIINRRKRNQVDLVQWLKQLPSETQKRF